MGADQQLPGFVLNALKRIASEHDLVDHEVQFEEGAKFGDGLTSEIIRVTVTGQSTSTRGEKSLVLVVKIPPESEERQKLAKISFEREVLVYNQVLPAFEKFQKDCGLTQVECFDSHPKCYFAHFDSGKDEMAIILEDLRERGLELGSSAHANNFECTKKLVKELGRFHAVQLAMKLKAPEVFKAFLKWRDVYESTVTAEYAQAIVDYNTARTLTALESPGDESYYERVEDFQKNFLKISGECTNSDSFEPYGVLIHGDFWFNNVMFDRQVSGAEDVHQEFS